jgi:HlyD family secretion protein
VQPDQNRFDVQSKKAQLARQQVTATDLARQVGALNLLSPVEGQVGQLQVADRAYVAKDAALLSVVDLTSLEVEIQVPESFARDLAPGMNAELTGNGGRWQGVLGGVSPEVVGGQVVARVRFAAEKPTGLRQNQRLSVRILIDRRDKVLMVDRGSFVDQDAGHVYVVRDDIATRQPIRLGASSISKVEILDGLAEGDRIVVSGADAFNGAERIILSH